MIRNIDPQAAQLTSDVLDRILLLREETIVPQHLSLPLVRKSIHVVKLLLKQCQPTWANSVAIQEGKRSKGGRNSGPSTFRSAPPKGQWTVDKFPTKEKT